MLLDAVKCQICSFYHFWVIKEKPTGGGGGVNLYAPPPPPDTHTHPDYS